jgi:hypothetical protein
MCGMCGGGWGSAPDWRQAGSRALEQQRLGCQRGSGRRSGQPQSYSLLAIRAALARPCVAADARASGRTLRACCPLGAPLGGCSTSRRAAPCPRCSRGTLPKGTPVCGSRTARPANHPTIACWRLAALPARATSGGGLSACAWGCRWHSLRNNARASRADGAAAMPPLHYRAAGALSRPRAHKPCRAARPLPLAACRWPHLGGARPPGPVSGLGRAARPGLYNGPYSGLWPSAALARTRARLAGAIAASDKPAIAGCQSGGAAPSPPEPQRRRRALLLILIP